FLHRRDKGFTTPEMLAWVRRCGLAFVGWGEPLLHSVTALAPGSAITDRLLALPEETQWAVLELLIGSAGKLEFNACRADRPESSYRISWSDEALRYIPVWAYGVAAVEEFDDDTGKGVVLRRLGHQFR